jgi:uncharacterized integral membrane protein
MKPRISMITPGVEDLETSVKFYQDGLGFPKMDSPPEVAFFTLNGTWLGLYGRESLKSCATVETKRILLIVVLLVIGIVWGATIPLAKVAVSSGHAPLGITFWEQVIVTIVTGFVLVARSIILRRRLRVPLDRDAIIYYPTIAAFGAVFPNLFS